MALTAFHSSCAGGSTLRLPACDGTNRSVTTRQYSSIIAMMRLGQATSASGAAAFQLKLATRLAGVVPTIDVSRHTIVFTHIGKTGGTTLDHIIKVAAAVTGKRACRPRPPRGRSMPPSQHNQELLHLDLMDDDQLSSCDYVSGHFPFGLHARLPRPCLYITLLRDPIARLLSNIRFGLDRDKWPRDASVTGLVEQGRLIDNMQTRQIAGIADRDAPCTSKTLATAIDNLRSHYCVVGVTERFDDALKALITLLGWPDIAYSDRQVSHAPSDSDLESRVRAAAERYFAVDMELYAYASALPTPWRPDILKGTATGNARQESVLVTSPLISFGNRPSALLSSAIFDTQIRPAVQQQGGEVVLV
jgi:hypothetical protein